MTTLAAQLKALEPLPPSTAARLAEITPQALRAKRMRGDTFSRQQMALIALNLHRLAEDAERMAGIRPSVALLAASSGQPIG